MNQKLALLEQIAEQHNYSLSHFLVPTVQQNGIQGTGRFVDIDIQINTTVAIIGGIIVDEPDQMICMPIGNKLYLHQVHKLFRATTNHSCQPNCKIHGFNELVSLRVIKAGEELTIDYGSVSVGEGNTIINNCGCGSKYCRGTIKTDDYKKLPKTLLSAYPKYIRDKNSVIHIFEYNNYDQEKLLQEAHSRHYEPFMVKPDDPHSDPSWFETGNDVNMKNWSQSRFFENELNKYPETKRVTEYFTNIIGTKDIRPRYYKLQANTSVPEHIDHNTKCGLNIILNKNAEPVEFVGIGKFKYRVALLNTSKLHKVSPHTDERILLKLSIMDVDFKTAKRKIIDNDRILQSIHRQK